MLVVEGRNVVLEYRWARSHPELFPTLAVELVQSRVSVIAAVSGVPSARAAKAATATIPIVFQIGDDPATLDWWPASRDRAATLPG